MLKKAMHVLLGTIFVVLSVAQVAQAVSFGKADVASKMGEPFYAEIPLLLNDTESVSKTSVELGSAADYRILEIYRNPVLGAIRADIVDDERGVRVALSSDAAIDEAFFNVILKVRYGRSTHYKKIPVFLDVASIAAARVAKPQKEIPVVDVVNAGEGLSSAFAVKTPKANKVQGKQAFDEPSLSGVSQVKKGAGSFQPYDGWARTSKYGPMVYGDTISTVADRLRIDGRFTRQQVMVALFNKNRAKFSRDNINVIKAGTFLDVPKADEVAQVSVEQAKQFLSDQNKVWKAMQSNKEFAALAEAQRNRYSSRVRIGKAATGTASQPIDKNKGAQAVEQSSVSKGSGGNSEPLKGNVKKAADEIRKNLEGELAKKNEALFELQQKMAALQEKLSAAEYSSQKDNITSLNTSEPAIDSAEAAALQAQNKKLELKLVRLNKQLQQAKKASVPSQSEMADWVMYALAGLGALVLALLIAVFMLMRKGREHPAEKPSQFIEEPDFVESQKPTSDLDATKVMDADDFDLPSDLNKTSEKSISDLDASQELFGTDEELGEIPELTDEETGEMEPFSAEGDAAPDPNVNYLEDADVYMRYGMEDEAEAQIKMALQLDAENPEAHAKMVQVQKAKGDDEAVENAMSAAKAALSGAALVAFDDAISFENNAEEQIDSDTLGGASEKVEDTESTLDAFDVNSDAGVPLQDGTPGDNSDMDVDFSGIGSSLDSEEAVADNTDFDIDFESLSADDESGISSNSGELEDISITAGLEISGMEETSDNISALDENSLLDIDTAGFEGLSVDETAEVELDSGTLMVSTDGAEPEDLTGLNDFEVAKVLNEAEEEKNAAAVELDVESGDPFIKASDALVKEHEEKAAVDLKAEEVGTLDGESDDALSLTDDAVNEIADDGTVDIDLEGLEADSNDSMDESLNDMNFDLPDLSDEASLSSGEATFIMDDAEPKEAEASDDSFDVGLDELNIDFDSLEANEEVNASLDDETFIMNDAGSIDKASASNVSDSSSLEAGDFKLDDLEMNFDLPDLSDEASETDESDSTFVMGTHKTDVSDSVDSENLMELDSDTEVSLEDINFDLPDLGEEGLEEPAADEVSGLDLDESLSDTDGDEIELSDLNGEIVDGIDTGMDDLDISTTAVTPESPSVNNENIDGISLNDDDLDDDIFSELDSDLSNLEEYEESMVSDVSSLSAENLDKTFVLNDVEKNKEMLKTGAEEATHFGSLDDALDGASSHDEVKDPMVSTFSSTAELEGINHTIDSIDSFKETVDDPMVQTFGASAELDDLMKDLDSLLDEDEDKK